MPIPDSASRDIAFILDPVIGDPFDPALDEECAALTRSQPPRRWPAPPVHTVLMEMVRTIVAHYHPLAIILFGSRAKGTARLRSDIDLLVVLEGTPNKRATAVAIREDLFFAEYGKDIVVTFPEEIVAEQDDPNSLVTRAIQEGKMIYDRRGAGA